MDIRQLRSMVVSDVIDSVMLKEQLKDYKKPRDKISAWLQSGALIQIKRGLYVFGKPYATQPYNMLLLSNILYGPSAVSLEYALSYYGLIPERVDTITAITLKRSKVYRTPLGVFTYRYLHPKKYSVGLTLLTIDQTHRAIIATQEKALCDLIELKGAKLNLNSLVAARNFLIEDLRIDEEKIDTLSPHAIRKINDSYQNPVIRQVIAYLESRSL